MTNTGSEMPGLYRAASIIVIIISVAAFLSGTILCSSAAPCGIPPAPDKQGAGLSNEDFIRFHVLANSGSEEDQAIKLKVRDEVISYLDEALVKEAVQKSEGTGGTIDIGIGETRRYISDHLSEIVDMAESVIAAEGCSYDVKAEFGVSWIPEKRYGSVIFPAGNYETLKLLIGEAEGHNWWCVLYPPLCLIDTESNAAEYGEIMKDAIMKGKYEELAKMTGNSSSGTGGARFIHLRFKTLDIVKRFAQ